MLVQARARWIAVVAALIVVPAIVAWGILAPGGGTGRQHGLHIKPISYPSPIANPLTRQHVPALGKGWKVSFYHTFKGTSLDTSVWGRCYPWTRDVAAGCSNFGNAEYEWYMPGQDKVYGDALHLVASRAPVRGTTRSGAPKEYYCRSGLVTSYPSLKFKYGYIKVVAWQPKGTGLWSGIWLGAADLKWPPEIDVVEHWGEPWIRTGVYFHPGGHHGSKAHLPLAEDAVLDTGWHDYSVLWNYHRITWFVDGKPIMTVAQNVTHQKMYLIMNLADYSHPKQTCYGQLRVKSVTVWQQAR